MSDHTSPRGSEPVHGALFWGSVVVGLGLVAFGVGGLLTDVGRAWPRVQFGLWVVGLDLAHDAAIAPAASVAGVVLARFLPRHARAPVRFGLFATAIVLFLAWSPLRRTARVTGNDSIQPLDYTTATLTVLAVVWAITAAWLALRARHLPRP